MTNWFKAKILGRLRVSTAVLVVAFIALFWVHETFTPEPKPQAPAPAVVPPGFVPDPNYTWVPRTNVRRPKEPASTTTTTAPTTTNPTETTSPTDTTSPTETTSPTDTSPTSPTSSTPQPNVVDSDGAGPLPPVTLPPLPTISGLTPTPPPPPAAAR